MKLYEIHYKQLYQKTRSRNRVRLMKPLFSRVLQDWQPGLPKAYHENVFRSNIVT